MISRERVNSMAWGKTHLKINKYMAPVVFAGTFALTLNPTDALLVSVGFYLIGSFVHPDLDLHLVTHTCRKIYEWCPTIGFIWRMYWTPYSRLIPHRSWVSHAPIIGTLIRLLYLLPVTLPAAYYVPGLFIWIIVGLGISDLVHYSVDITTSWVRKREKRRA